MKEISLFPLLSDRHIQRIGFRILERMSFFYTKGEQEVKFQVDEAAVVKALGGSGWDPDVDNFGVSAKYEIKNPVMAFGQNGFVCKDAVIGTALIWKSQDSKQRGVVPINEFSSNERNIVIELHHVFPKAMFRGRLSIDVVFYLKTAGNPLETERHLSNLEGTVFGAFDSVNVLFDGVGAIFQINEVAETGGLLWSVNCDFEDPLSDSFFDSIEITVNPLHPNYRFIDRNSQERNPEMLREILSSAMTIVAMYVRNHCNDQEWLSILSGKVERGSVGDLMHYMVKKLNVDTESPELCSESIRKIMERKGI